MGKAIESGFRYGLRRRADPPTESLPYVVIPRLVGYSSATGPVPTSTDIVT